jgi:ketosteroid isomerase-like protein
MTARDIVAETLHFWSAQDVESTLAHFHPNVVYRMNIDRELVALGGETYGIDAVRDAFFGLLEHWDYLQWSPVIVQADGRIVRAKIDAIFHHRRSGRDLVDTYRIVFEVEDGLIIRVDEFHDRAKIEAFLAMTAALE